MNLKPLNNKNRREDTVILSAARSVMMLSFGRVEIEIGLVQTPLFLPTADVVLDAVALLPRTDYKIPLGVNQELARFFSIVCCPLIAV